MTNSQQLAEDTLADTLVLINWVLSAYADGEVYEGQDAGDYLNEMPLEIVNQRGAPFTIVLGIGGPHVEVTCQLDEAGDRRGPATLSVYWGGGSAENRGDRDVMDFADYFISMYEGQE